MLIVSGISLPFTAPLQEAIEQAQKIIGVPTTSAWIAKRAVDARHKQDIRFVYSVAAEVAGKPALSHPQIRIKEPDTLTLVQKPCKTPPVIVGFGPAGMFAALVLARTGQRPIVLERGADVDTRTRDVESFMRSAKFNPQSNIQFGEGGAGTFSDGKLTTRINDPYCTFVLQELVRHGAPREILLEAKPHVGTDKLREIVKSIRSEIIRLGGAVHFHTTVTDILLQNGCVCGVKTNQGELAAEKVILAPGHSARDTVAALHKKGIVMQAKPFSVGLRVEHLQAEVDKALYGDFAGHPLLPRAEYQHSLRKNGRCVYTFCMCPGGTVVAAASEENAVVTNGMSEYLRDGKNANSALAVSVDVSDFGSDPLGGIKFQQHLEQAAFLQGGGNYNAPAQNIGAFLNGKPGLSIGQVRPTYQPGVYGGDFAGLFPAEITALLQDGLRAFNVRQAGFAAADGILTGVETRTSSPVRILRGEDFQAPDTAGLFPCGEGAGYAGGIMSAAVDGIRVAMQVVAGN